MFRGLVATMHHIIHSLFFPMNIRRDLTSEQSTDKLRDFFAYKLYFSSEHYSSKFLEFLRKRRGECNAINHILLLCVLLQVSPNSLIYTILYMAVITIIQSAKLVYYYNIKYQNIIRYYYIIK